MLFKLLLIGMLSCDATDTTTSLMAFHRGAIERNPFIISTKPAPFLIETTAFTVLHGISSVKLHKKHPKLANTLLIVSMGVSVAASVNNVRVYKELGPRR